MFDESVLTAVTDAAHINPGDLVLEIGPGTGGLTKHLLERGALLTAVEKDYVLHDKLVEEYKDVSCVMFVAFLLCFVAYWLITDHSKIKSKIQPRTPYDLHDTD